jgi:polyisoprenoid-binding protein YceI
MAEKMRFLFLYLLLLPLAQVSGQGILLLAEHGIARIKSDAPLELIKAESKTLRGVIDPSTKSFAFTMRINSFEGFNSEIQQTHFLENYMEQKKYPQATFKGKFIEDIPFTTPGVYSVRAKGNLDVHGISKERIIRGTLTVREGSAKIQVHFLVPVSDHGITIPKIVMQKIAEEIEVDIDVEFVESKRE